MCACVRERDNERERERESEREREKKLALLGRLIWVSYRFPRHSSSIIDTLNLYVNGTLIENIQVYAHLYNTLCDIIAAGGSAGAGTPPGSCSLGAGTYFTTQFCGWWFCEWRFCGSWYSSWKLVSGSWYRSFLLEAVLVTYITLCDISAAGVSVGAGTHSPPGICSLGAGTDPFCLKLFCCRTLPYAAVCHTSAAGDQPAKRFCSADVR
jgi:hypothetical protein